MAVVHVLLRRLPLGLMACSLALVAFLHGDYGITWDEPNQHQYGTYVVRYYETLFADRSALTYLDAYLYGGLFDSLAALLVRVSPLGVFETRHLANALVGLVGIAGVWKMARLVGSEGAAALATALIFFEPSYFGHMFNNPKDIPFAAGYAWSVYFLMRCLGQLPHIPLRLQLLTGLAIGLTLGVRIGGLILLAYLAAAVLLALVHPAWFTGDRTAASASAPLLALARSLAGIVATAYAVMLVFWPWAQQNPAVRPFEALAFMSRFKLTETGLLNQVLIGGEYLPAWDLPFTYLPHYFAVKLPETVLAGLVFALLLALTWRPQPRTSLQTGRLVLLASAAILPVCYAAAVGAVLYDTMRHFLFIVPILCILAGLGWAAAIDRLTGGCSRRTQHLILVVVSCAILAPQAYRMVVLHPHQYVHYNALAGGLKGAQGRYELDYWANSYKEAVELLNAHIERGGGPAGRATRVCAVLAERSASYYYPDHFVPVSRPEGADYVICFTRWELDRRLPGKTIAAVERQGTVLAVVKQIERQ